MSSLPFSRRHFPWLIVVGYAASIYATLGYVPRLTASLQTRGILGNVTVAILFLLGGVVIFRLRRLPSLYLRVVTALLVGISLLISLFLPFPAERMHVVEYGILGSLLGWALARSGKWPAWCGGGVLSVWLIGSGDEMMQWFLPNRVFDVRDILLNGIAGMLGLGIFAIFATGTCGAGS